MRFAAVFLALGLLAGCAQYDSARQENLAATAQARTASDDAACRSSGAQPNSAEYEDCRRRYANQHAQESHRQNDLANQMLNSNKPGPIGQ
jgi:hypothetical protein